MAENPYPIPRQLRESEVLVGDGGDTYGPFDFQIFDIDDVFVLARPDGSPRFSAVPDIVVEKVNGNNVLNPLDFFTIKFPTAVPVTTRYIVGSARVASRDAGVIQGTRIHPDALEKEFSKLATQEQELRRDINRAWKSDPGQPGLTLDSNVEDGDVLMRQGDRLVKGPNAEEIAGAEGFAEQALEASEAAQDALTQILGLVPSAFPVSRSQLKALPVILFTTAFLKEAGREGHFLWQTGDFVARVAADTTEGIYIKADGISAGVGAWVRQVSGPYLSSWFGAKGDGATDDTTALQVALNIISMRGGGKLILGAGSFKISASLEYTPITVVGDPIAGSDLLFAGLPVLQIVGTGSSRIVASVAMPHMLRLTFGAGEPAPNQCLLENVAFNGAGLATIGVLSSWPLGTTIRQCRIFGVDIGVKVYGRGGAAIYDNFIRARIGVQIIRGGDTVIEKNHIFLKGAAGSVRIGVQFGAQSGNSRCVNNTMQAEATDNADHVNTRGVHLDGVATDTVGSEVVKGVRDIVIDGNEFHGIQTCVFAVSDTLTLNSGVCTVHVTNNHAMQGWWTSTQLVYAQKVVNLIVSGNFHNIVGSNSVNLAAAQFDGCVDVDFRNNQISNVSGTNAVLVTSSSDDVRIEENVFVNAVLTAGQAVVFVQNSNFTKVKKNVFKQYSAFTTICVTEAGTTAVGNDFRDNDFSASFTVPYSTFNSNTIARRVEYRTWSPPDASWGTWRVGDVIYLMGPTAGGSIGFVCTAAGAPGTWKSFGGISA